MSDDTRTEPVFKVELPDVADNILAASRRVQREYGKTTAQQTFEFLKLALGRGRITTAEYYSMRLFDDENLAGVDKREFVGRQGSTELVRRINGVSRWMEAVDDKIAFKTLLGGLGFPVPVTKAIYGTTPRSAIFANLRDEHALRQFLAEPSHYPMFGKPAYSSLSLGAESLDHLNAEAETIETSGGDTIPLSDFVSTIAEHYKHGYLFQERIVCHSKIRSICGHAVPTVRVVTAKGEILGAVWKIPAAGNIADNLWRPGNLLAAIDDSGSVTRVVRGVGLDQVELVEHPDTGVPLVGLKIPHWDEIVRTTTRAATFFGSLLVIGWDVAVTKDGCILVEGNTNPDLRLLQITSRVGVYGARLKQLENEVAKMRRETKKRARSARLAVVKKNSSLAVKGKATHV